MSSKTYKKQICLYHTVTSAEAIATAARITVLNTVLSDDDVAFITKITRSGVDIPGFDADFAVSNTSGIITVANAGAVSLTAGDVITIFATFK